MCECYKFAFEHGMKETDLKVQSSDFISWLNEEHKILDEEEKEYLSNVIKPFKNRINYIKKYTLVADYMNLLG